MTQKILILDDDPVIRMLYADELAEEGYDVITDSGNSPLMSLIEENNPNMVIMETRLGGRDGLALLQDIRNTCPNLPVILCTAHPFLRFDFRSAAADHFLVKSFSLAPLKEAVKQTLQTCIWKPFEDGPPSQRALLEKPLEPFRLSEYHQP